MKKLLALALVVAGCSDLETPPITAPNEKAGGRMPEIASTVLTVPGNLTSVVVNQCRGCHDNTVGYYPAGVQIASNGSTITIPTGMTIQDVHTAFAKEPAPANKHLGGSDQQNFINWVVGGITPHATGTTYTVPSTMSWSQVTHQSTLTVPGSGIQSKGYFGITVEDGTAPTIALEYYTDNYNGLTLQCMTFCDYDSIPYSEFHHSDDPTNYVVPAGVDWCGRPKIYTLGGYVRVDGEMFITVHTREMREGPDADHKRDYREYVRFQVTGSGRMGWWRKKYNVHDERETVGDWVDDLNTSANLLEHDDYSYGGGIGEVEQIEWASDLFRYARFMWVRMTIWQDSAGMHYLGEVWNRAEGLSGATRLGAAAALRTTDLSEAYGGFQWGAYPRNSSGKKHWVANWAMSASSTYGGGETVGACSNCEGGGGEIDELWGGGSEDSSSVSIKEIK